jgi:hypothetical protein
MVKISLVGVCVLLMAAAAVQVGHAFYPGYGGYGVEMMPGVCPPSGCPPMAAPMAMPGFAPPPMPKRIVKSKPSPAPYCGPVACPPPACAPAYLPVCKPPVCWY